MEYEVLDETGAVVNTVMADQDYMVAVYPDGNFRPVVRVVQPLPEPVVIEAPKIITRLAFLTRFTDAEAVAFDLASIGATVEAAMIRRYLSKVNAAEFIDLGDAQTRGGVLALEAGGLLTSGRALQILDAEIQPNEVYKG